MHNKQRLEAVKMLTAKQDAFAQSVAAGMELSAAYRQNYSCGRMSERAVWTEASKLRKNPKVALRIAELQRQNEEQEIWTRRNIMERLVRIADEAKQAISRPVLDANRNVVGVQLDPAAARVELQAVDQASKILGLYEQKINARVSSQSIEDYLKTLDDD